jgi:hypothetical protein
MAGRVLVAGIIGGIALFIGGLIAHLVVGISDRAIQSLPDESAVLGALDSTHTAPGFYLFPGMPRGASMSDPAAVKALDAKMQTSPRGLVVLAAPSGGIMPLRKLVMQLVGDMMAAMLAAILLGIAAVPTYVGRLLFTTMLGLFAGCLISLPYWNWYGFPTNFTVGAFIDHVVRCLAGGLVLAAFMKPKRA